MQFIKSDYRVNGKHSHLNVLLFNDLHMGAPEADFSILKKAIDFALANQDNTRILLNGDYIEGVTKLSKGDIYTQRMTPKEQINAVVELLKPVKHLIDAITIGNHDWRIENETSIDVVEMIARYLGIEEKYVGSRGVVGFDLGQNKYTVDMHHGTGGGGTIASVENSMKKLWKSDSDVMYCGHWHKEFAKPIKRFALDWRSNKVVEEKRWMICGNTILNTAEYAVRGGFEESFPSLGRLELAIEGQKDIDVRWFR